MRYSVLPKQLSVLKSTLKSRRKRNEILKNYDKFICYRYDIGISNKRYLKCRHDTDTDISRYRRYIGGISDISTHLSTLPDSQPTATELFQSSLYGSGFWNSLPQHITSVPSLPVFCCRLRTLLRTQLSVITVVVPAK